MASHHTKKMALLFVAAGLASSANAMTTAITATNTAGNQEFGGSLGFDFIVNSTISVTQLGAFDDNGDGFNLDITVGIYSRDDNGTPLDFTDDFPTSKLFWSVTVP